MRGCCRRASFPCPPPAAALAAAVAAAAGVAANQGLPGLQQLPAPLPLAASAACPQVQWDVQPLPLSLSHGLFTQLLKCRCYLALDLSLCTPARSNGMLGLRLGGREGVSERASCCACSRHVFDTILRLLFGQESPLVHLSRQLLICEQVV